MATATLTSGTARNNAQVLENTPLLNFYNSAKSLGFAKDNFFRVTSIDCRSTGTSDINAAKSINNFFKDPNKYLFVKTGAVPSRKINTTKFYYKSFGFNVPTNAIYPTSSNWALKFYSDDKYFIKDIFEFWSQQLYNEHSFKSGLNLNTDINFSLYRPSRLEDTFKLTGSTKANNRKITDSRTNKQQRLDIFKLQEVRNYKLYGCFPVQIGEILYDTTKAGNLVSIDVTFAFQYIGSETPGKLQLQSALDNNPIKSNQAIPLPSPGAS